MLDRQARAWPLQMERVERLGEEAWAGVAQVDWGVAPADWGCASLKCYLVTQSRAAGL